LNLIEGFETASNLFAEILIWIINILKVKVKVKVQKLFFELKQKMTV